MKRHILLKSPRRHWPHRFLRLRTALVAGALLLAGLAAPARVVMPDQELASASASKMVSWAWSQVGYGCGHYGWCSYAWCALFASKDWNHSGGSMGTQYSVSGIHTWLVNHGRWHGGSGAYHKPGDLILFKDAYGHWAHIGIIVNGTGVGGSVRSIDGNWANKVSVVGYYRVYNPGSWEPGLHVVGYGVPPAS